MGKERLVNQIVGVARNEYEMKIKFDKQKKLEAENNKSENLRCEQEKNLERLKKTGIVSLFKYIRDSKLVIYSKEDIEHPNLLEKIIKKSKDSLAQISFSEENTKITLKFDYISSCLPPCRYKEICGVIDSSDVLKIGWSREDGLRVSELHIGELRDVNNNLEEVVGTAIVEAKNWISN